MNDEVASIWIKIGNGNINDLLLGGVYREFTLFCHENPESTREIPAQTARWKLFVNQWVQASNSSHCVVMGYLNLDIIKWENPDADQKDMIELIKMEIEPRHCTQHINNPTRFWPGAESSLLDHCWSNNPQKIISTRNITCGSSDHNVICAKIRKKGQDNFSQEILGRDRRNFNIEDYRNKLKELDWNYIYLTENLDIAYSCLEEKNLKVLNSTAPMLKTQPRKHQSDWISMETKILMKRRDIARDIAVISSRQEDWKQFRSLRNKCTSQVKSDRNNHLKSLHEVIAEKRDTKALYKLTKRQMGWKSAGTPVAFQKNGIITRNPTAIANIQLNYFHKFFENLMSALPVTNHEPLLILKNAFNRWANKA